MAINTATPFGIIKVNAADFPATKVEGSFYIWKGGCYVATSATEAELLGQITYSASLAAVSEPVQGRLYITDDTKTIHRWNGEDWQQIAAPAEGGSNDASSLTGVIPPDVIAASELVTEDALETVLDNRLASAMTYKGTKATYGELPEEGNKQGDVWNVTTSPDGSGHNYAWDGTGWDQLGGVVSLANYVTLDGDDVIGGDKTFTNTINGTITAAQALAAARTFSVSGKAAAAGVLFDGTANVDIQVTSLDASGLTGAIPSAVTAETQDAVDNSTKIATTAFVKTAVSNAETKWTVIE
ncbi:MAG: hypothetical protein LBT46_15390 [Planctomycetaceae bacterium]|jgi:hypothetical protein|nr:hypothetical protein [Planctomycetaceae bacterium]